MLAIIEHNGKTHKVNLNEPIDISIPMRSGSQNPNAFGIQPPLFSPFTSGSFIGSVAQGGSVNCENLTLNPHGNGTHTECVGHIAKVNITIYTSLKQFMSLAQLITVAPTNNKIGIAHVQHLLQFPINALIIRTTPNSSDKCTRNYSGANPAFLDAELCDWLADNSIEHLLIDLPSVDPEHDEGTLSAHHAFWQYPNKTRLTATITEMVYIPDTIPDGNYLLNLQIASLETDASPSKPILYTLHSV